MEASRARGIYRLHFSRGRQRAWCRSEGLSAKSEGLSAKLSEWSSGPCAAAAIRLLAILHSTPIGGSGLGELLTVFCV